MLHNFFHHAKNVQKIVSPMVLVWAHHWEIFELTIGCLPLGSGSGGAVRTFARRAAPVDEGKAFSPTFWCQQMWGFAIKVFLAAGGQQICHSRGDVEAPRRG